MRRRPLLVALPLALALGLAVVRLAPRAERPAPPPPAPEAFVLRGTVTASGGAGIPGAKVELLAVDDAHAFTSLGEAAASPDAAFAIPFTPPAGAPGLLMARATAPGHASEGRVVEPGDGRVDFRLSAERASVRVEVEAGAARPQPGAEVLLTFEPIAAPGGALYAWRAAADPGGVAVFEGLPILEGKIHVLAEHGGARAFREYAKPAGARGTAVTIRLDRGRAVRGRLLAKERGDLTAAEVTLRELEGPWLVRVRPDAAGAFELADVPAGTQLVAEVAGEWVLADGAAHPWQVPAGADPGELALRVVPGGAIAGIVVDAADRPIGAARVTVTPEREAAGGAHAVISDGAGRFAVSGLPLATSWIVEARHPDHARARATAVAPRTKELRLRLHAGGAIVGRIVDRQGRGVGDVEVYAHAMARAPDGATALPEHDATRTGPDGRYRLGRLNPGTYRLEVRPAARMQWSPVAGAVKELEVREGDNAQPDLRVLRGASLAGRIERGPGDAAEEAVEVALLPAAQRGIPHRVQVQPDAAGAFEVTGLEDGAFRVLARTAGRGWSTPVEVALVDGAAAEATFRFANDAQLDGRVAFADGTIPRGARVEVYREAGPARAAHDLSGNWSAVDPDGRFSVTGLAAGDHYLRIASDDAAPLVVPIRIGRGRERRSFVVERGATIEVALVSSKGAPAPADRIVMLEASSAHGHRAQGIADAAGLARFERVPAGEYRARAVVPGMPTVTVAAARPRTRVELRVD